jgi:hypothetical protein
MVVPLTPTSLAMSVQRVDGFAGRPIWNGSIRLRRLYRNQPTGGKTWQP